MVRIFFWNGKDGNPGAPVRVSGCEVESRIQFVERGRNRFCRRHCSVCVIGRFSHGKWGGPSAVFCCDFFIIADFIYSFLGYFGTSFCRGGGKPQPGHKRPQPVIKR